MEHFVNKLLGKRCIVYSLKLYYSELPDVESDLVILKLFMYPPHVQFNFPHNSCDCCINYCGFDVLSQIFFSIDETCKETLM